MMLRENSQRLRDEFRYVQDMGLNTIRLEGKLETKEFFDLADREGILVMAGWCCCDHWEHWPNWKPQDFAIAEQSLRDQIYRLRSHPSRRCGSTAATTRRRRTSSRCTSKVEKRPAVAESGGLLRDRESWRCHRRQRREDVRALRIRRAPYWLTDKTDMAAYQLQPGRLRRRLRLQHRNQPGPAVPPIESIRAMVGKDHLWPIDDRWNYHAGGGAFKDHPRFHRRAQRALRQGRPAPRITPSRRSC